MAIVNVFTVGMPKAGTTSLHQYLSQHPEIFMSEDKEPHYFSFDLTEAGESLHGSTKYTRYPNLESYHRLFASRASAQVVGESSVFYLHSKRAAAEIASYNPDAKIIIMIREPVSFLYSLHAQGVYSGNETESDFERALLLQPERRSGAIPSTTRFPSRLYYDEHALLAEQVSRYYEHFPREQIKVILFDDFVADLSNSYCDVLDFLGVDASFVPDFINHNPNTRIKSSWLNNIIQDPNHPMAIGLKWVFPKQWLRKVKFVVRQANTVVADRTPLNPDLRRQLRRQFSPEVEKINELLHHHGVLEERSLVELWGYNSP